MAPQNPVRMTTRTVSASIPPISLLIPIAIGAVTDFGMIDANKTWSKPHNFVITITETIFVKQPATIPDSTAKKSFLIFSKFLYKGTAKHTVVGVKK